jgi:hypothetical protein
MAAGRSVAVGLWTLSARGPDQATGAARPAQALVVAGEAGIGAWGCI